MKERSLLLTILMVCAQQLGLLVVGLWLSSSRELTCCDQNGEISSRQIRDLWFRWEPA